MMAQHGYLPGGQPWNLVRRDNTWEVIVGLDYADETYHRVYQGTLDACRAYLRQLRRNCA